MKWNKFKEKLTSLMTDGHNTLYGKVENGELVNFYADNEETVWSIIQFLQYDDDERADILLHLIVEKGGIYVPKDIYNKDE